MYTTTMQQPQLSVFWIAVEKIEPNPFQPRKEFSEDALVSLAQSIRQYGVLQPLVVTRKEVTISSGDTETRYELIAGERRLRASKRAGLQQVPVVIRSDIKDNNIRLELAIIENLQREDLNPIDRARAFRQLINEFTMTHTEVAYKMGRSREYISNSLRLLTLPEDMIQAVIDGKMSEGHTRPLLMLSDTQQEQRALFDEIINRRITVRDSEDIARRQAVDRVRKKETNPYVQEAQTMIEGLFDTRVHIQSQGERGGKIVIDYFSEDDLKGIVEKLAVHDEVPKSLRPQENSKVPIESAEEIEEDDEMYTFKNFSL